MNRDGGFGGVLSSNSSVFRGKDTRGLCRVLPPENGYAAYETDCLRESPFMKASAFSYSGGVRRLTLM